PSWRILFNIGQVEMELQDYAGALKAYTRYLKEGGPDVPADRTAQVNAEIERLRGRVGFLAIQTAAGAQVLIDDVQVGYSPLPDPVPVAAGQHRVTVAITGKEPVSRVFDVAGRETVTAALALDLAAPPPPGKQVGSPPAAPSPSGPKSRTPVYVAWGITGGLVVGAGVFGVLAHNASNDLATLRDSYPVTHDQLQAQKDTTVRDAAITDVLAGAAVVSAGIALYFTVTRTGHVDKERTVQLHVTPTGVALAGVF
ncbi:MAG TPA: PEGA domain-containing protein, partial [Kofleriaceae bacterium]|nr:PEGA domain-containing protein [Kofleriaceae bacterium]